MLLVEYRKESFDYPAKACSVALGRKKQLGRPAFTKSALEFQDLSEDEYVISDSSDDETAAQSAKPNKKTKTKKRITQKKNKKDNTDDESSYNLFSLEEVLPVTETQSNSKCSKITITKVDPTSKAKTSKSKDTDDEPSYDLFINEEARPAIDTQQKSKGKKRQASKAKTSYDIKRVTRSAITRK